MKSLLGVEWSDTSLVDAFSNKGLLLDGNSPNIMCLCNFVGTHSWNRQFRNDAWALDGDEVTLRIVIGSSLGILSGVVFVDFILFANSDLFPINWSFN